MRGSLHDRKAVGAFSGRGWKTSLIVHGTLLFAVFVVPFLKGCATKKPKDELIFVEFTVAVPPAAAPEPEPAKPEPELVPEPEPEPEPDIPEPEPPKPPEKKPEPPKPPEKKPDPPTSIRQTNRVTRTVSTVQPRGPVLSEREIAEMLKKGAKIGPVTSIPSDASAMELGAYYNQVHAIMKSAWNQPRDLGTLPGMECVVELHVADDGSITRGSIVGRSGNATMDGSVQAVLDRKPKLPRPPGGARTITVTFSLQ